MDNIGYFILPVVLVALIGDLLEQFVMWFSKLIELELKKEDAYNKVKMLIVSSFAIINIFRIIKLLACIIGLVLCLIKVIQLAIEYLIW